MKVLVSHPEVIASMAHWAVRQHPYNQPPRLFEVTEKIKQATQVWEDGIASLRMKYFEGCHELEVWLRIVLREDPVLELWNTPRSGHTSEYMFVSAYPTPRAEHDFIDIDALLRNVARTCWWESLKDSDMPDTTDDEPVFAAPV